MLHTRGAKLRAIGDGDPIMTYVNRMCLRMMLPALAVTAAGVGMTAFGREAVTQAAAAETVTSALPAYLGYATVVIGLLMTTVQLVRLVRWKSGASASCFVCSCLLLAERESRSGIYRRCSGCGKTHGCSGLLRAAR
jgi:hypothetical protein